MRGTGYVREKSDERQRGVKEAGSMRHMAPARCLLAHLDQALVHGVKVVERVLRGGVRRY